MKKLDRRALYVGDESSKKDFKKLCSSFIQLRCINPDKEDLLSTLAEYDFHVCIIDADSDAFSMKLVKTINYHFPNLQIIFFGNQAIHDSRMYDFSDIQFFDVWNYPISSQLLKVRLDNACAIYITKEREKSNETFIKEIQAKLLQHQGKSLKRKAISKALFNAPNQWAVLADKNGVIIDINDAAISYKNSKKEDYVGKYLLDCFYGAYENKKEALLQEALVDKKKVDFTDTICGVKLNIQMYPILKGNGETQALAIYARDVNENMHDERVQSSEERFRTVFESSPDGYFLLDSDSRINVCNKAIEKIFGYRREDLVGEHFSAINWAPESQVNYIDAIVERVNNHEATGPQELVLYKRDRSRILVEIRTMPIAIQDSYQTLGIVKDLTVRKEMEDALVESELNYFNLFEYATDAIMLMDADTLEFIRVNDRATEQFGYTKSEFLKMKLFDLLPEDKISNSMSNVKMIKSKGKGIVRSWHIKKDGSLMPVEISVKLINFLGKEVFQSFVRDISVQENARQAIEELNKELENSLLTKSNELEGVLNNLKQTQEQLLHAEKMSSLGQLSAGIAHEINNPINYIKQNVYSIRQGLKDYEELLKTLDESMKDLDADHPVHNQYEDIKEELELDYLREELSRAIEDIQEGLDQAIDITDELKYYSRTDEENGVKSDEVHHVVDSILKLMKAEIDKKKIVIEKSFIDDMDVFCNVNKLNQVLMNIINNAIHAIKESENSGVISVRTQLVNGNKLVKLTLQDDGTGMSDEVKEHLFDPFYTTKKIGEGTGLGMSISKNIINALGGRIEVESTLGVGSCFNIYLPVENAVVKKERISVVNK